MRHRLVGKHIEALRRWRAAILQGGGLLLWQRSQKEDRRKRRKEVRTDVHQSVLFGGR
jgi:hypothetical protein